MWAGSPTENFWTLLVRFYYMSCLSRCQATWLKALNGIKSDDNQKKIIHRTSFVLSHQLSLVGKNATSCVPGLQRQYPFHYYRHRFDGCFLGEPGSAGFFTCSQREPLGISGTSASCHQASSVEALKRTSDHVQGSDNYIVVTAPCGSWVCKWVNVKVSK